MRAAWRGLRAVWHAVAGWLTIAFVFPRLDESQRHARVQAWAAEMLRILGIRLEVRGTPPLAGPVLLVANHISWLDILVMHAARHCRFISKADVKHWPLIGSLATGAGTLYIERSRRRDAMRVVHHMAERLKEGDVLAVFPEGTTTDGSRVLPFHGNLLEAAIKTASPVQPLALRYLDARTRKPSQAARYIDDDSLLGSVWRLLSSPPVVAVVSFGQPQAPAGRDRRTLAHDLRTAVEALAA